MALDRFRSQATTKAATTLSVKERLRFYRALLSQLRAERPLKAAIDRMVERLTRRDREPVAAWRRRLGLPGSQAARQPLARALQAWSVKLAAGQGLAEAMQGWIPNSERILVLSGERAERLLETFEELIVVVKERQRIGRALTRATAYPLVLFVLICAVLYVFGLKIIPTFEQTIPPERWQGLSYGLLMVSKVLREAWWLFLVAAISLAFAFVWSLPRWRGALRCRVDRLPPWSIYRLTEGAAFMKALQVLTSTGTQLLTALGLIAQNASPWLRERVEAVIHQVSQGQTLADAMDATGYEFPDRIVVDTLMILSDDKDFAATLKGVVADWSSNLTEDIEQQSSLLLIGGVVMVGLILALCFLALFSLTNTLSATVGLPS
ncbi:MAG: type II secretion system F family protein [Betaproteobacteria bacterium]|nr:type II secretion system F family protein [Betaproteobacteria bacterium]